MSQMFPTNKPHISYSEIRAWAECPFRHHLMYVEKINTYKENPYADFGTIIHEEIENFINNKVICLSTVFSKIDETWEKKGYDSQEFINLMTEERAINGWKYKHETISEWKQSAENILNDFPKFVDETFPGWEPISAEVELYEKLRDNLSFKGFIDCVISVPKNKKTNI